MLVIAFFIPAMLQAQNPPEFDFGPGARHEKAALVFYHPGAPDLPYYVTITAAGLVFDDQVEYSEQLIDDLLPGDKSPREISDPTGILHASQVGETIGAGFGDVKADYDPYKYLGAGVYELYLERGNYNVTVRLDLTDANWATGQGGTPGFRNILMEPQLDGSGEFVKVYISHEDEVNEDLIHCEDFYEGETIRYWDLVRKDGSDPQYKDYARDRTGFSIDPNYRGPDQTGIQNTDNLPGGTLSEATLDVHVVVRDDVVIPQGKSMTITTDPDQINAPNLEETIVLFEAGKGLTVASGGELITCGSTPFGVVDFAAYNGTNKGDWTGIVGQPSSSLDLSSLTITHAVKGLMLESVQSAYLNVCLIEESRDLGLQIHDCSPVVNLSLVGATGISTGGTPGVNVLIEGPTSAPVFTSSTIRDAVRLPMGGSYFGGHGVEITGTGNGEALFEECQVLGNEGYGFYIHNGGGETRGPYIYGSAIANNETGIYVRQVPQWTTLRESRVHGHTQGYGILLEGTDAEYARIRGWYHEDPMIDPNDPADVDRIVLEGETEGNNCIYENYMNARAQEYGRFDLGSEYVDPRYNYVTLGGRNSLFDAIYRQGIVDFWSHGGFRVNWWDNDYSMDAWNGSTLDMGAELPIDEVGCTEVGKRSASVTGSHVGDLLLYRRTRGTMRLPEASTDAPVTTAAQEAVPSDILLGEAYPNPFNPYTSVTMTLLADQDLHVRVTDVLGRHVATLAEGPHEAGRYTLRFHAGHLPSGVYYIVLQGNGGTQTRPLLLAK